MGLYLTGVFLKPLLGTTNNRGELMMKLLSIVTSALISVLLISLNALAQDTIGECEQRCGIRRTDMGQVIGNPQMIAACRDRCNREYWKKFEGKEKEGKK